MSGVCRLLFCRFKKRSKSGRAILVFIWITLIMGMLLTISVIQKYHLLRLIPVQREDCYLTTQQQEQLRHILRHVVTIFEDMNVTYWLDYGTLLGALRNGDIMDYDTDGDISFLSNKYYKPQEIKHRLQKFDIEYGYGLSYFSRAWYEKMWVDVTRWTVRDGIYDGRTAKLVVKDQSTEEERNRDFVTQYRDENEKFPFQWLQSRKTIQFLNATAKVPSDADKLVRHRYPYTYRFNVPYKFKCWL